MVRKKIKYDSMDFKALTWLLLVSSFGVPGYFMFFNTSFSL